MRYFLIKDQLVKVNYGHIGSFFFKTRAYSVYSILAVVVYSELEPYHRHYHLHHLTTTTTRGGGR